MMQASFQGGLVSKEPDSQEIFNEIIAEYLRTYTNRKDQRSFLWWTLQFLSARMIASLERNAPKLPETDALTVIDLWFRSAQRKIGSMPSLEQDRIVTLIHQYLSTLALEALPE